MTTLAIIIQQVSRYFATIPVEKAWLFGSYAEGTPSVKSDIDILVEYTPGYRPGLLGIARINNELETLLEHKVDLVESGTFYPYITPHVESSKIMIYERKSA